MARFAMGAPTGCFLLALLLSAPAMAQTPACTPQCIQYYQSRGLPAWEAQRVCRCGGVAPGAAATCVTSIGTCRMSSAVPAGSYCVCASPQGPVAGRAQ